MSQAQIELSTGKILALGEFPAGSPEPATIVIRTLNAAQEAQCSWDSRSANPGQRILNEDGTVTITPPPPPSMIYSGEMSVSLRVRTIDATATDIYRRTLSPLTGYAALLTLLGVDAGNGAVRMIQASIVAKRLAAGAALVGAPVVVANFVDTGTATWGITASVSGNDIVISVTGASGRTIDWLLRGEIRSFTPGGA